MFKRWLSTPQANFLLLGPRRAGKTTYLKEKFNDFKYITLDDFDYLEQAESDPKGLLGDQRKIIIDEIQRVPKLTIAVKYALDQQKAKIIMTGSSRLGLLDSSADTLAGRIKILSLPTMCWGEEEGTATHAIFADQLSLPQIKNAQRKLLTALTYGGFPEIVSAKSNKEKSELLRNYKNTYFTRDVSLLSNIENVSGILAILHHLGQSIGSISNVSNFRRESGLSHPTTQKYLNVLSQSDLSFKLLGFQYGPAKRQLKAAKSYYCDNGMIHALGIQCSQGQILENFVISELEKRRKLGFYESDQLYYYQTAAGAEIDIILQDGPRLNAIEIKATRKPRKRDCTQLKNFISQDPKHRRGFLFYMGESYLEIDGVQCLPVASIYRGR